MRLSLLVLACAAAFAQTKPADDVRAFLESFEAALKRPDEAMAEFFTEERNGFLLATAHSMRRPMSETVSLGLDIESVHYVAPGVAFVYANRRIIGSLVLGRMPVAFVLVKRADGWRIGMYRLRIDQPRPLTNRFTASSG